MEIISLIIFIIIICLAITWFSYAMYFNYCYDNGLIDGFVEEREPGAAP